MPFGIGTKAGHLPAVDLSLHKSKDPNTQTSRDEGTRLSRVPPVPDPGTRLCPVLLQGGPRTGVTTRGSVPVPKSSVDRAQCLLVWFWVQATDEDPWEGGRVPLPSRGWLGEVAVIPEAS